jgi:serine/threonine-protein kinase
MPVVGISSNMNAIENLNANRFIGRQIGTATIVKELARGGMAVVFIGYQRTLKRRIAVKVLPKADLNQQRLESFQTEAEAAATLSHPNIIQIYEVGDTEDFLFFTMQLVQGKMLSTILNRAKKQILPTKRVLPVKQTVETIIQVLDALDYAHRQDIVHLDIKPDNIMVENHTGRPLITDFGIARVMRGQANGGPTTAGSPLYMAPEQIIDSKIDGRADIYAVGIMLFQMLVPALPIPRFDSHESLLRHKLLSEDGIFLQQPSEINPVLSRDMDMMIRKSTAYTPENRYATCREFIKDLHWYERRVL